MLDLKAIQDAEARGEQKRQELGYAVNASYSRETGRLTVCLASQLEFSLPTSKLEGLSEATPEQLEQVEITPSGFGLHWEDLDVDLSIPHLLSGYLGSKHWMRELGRKGGEARTEKKAVAARKNGKKGGRPRKGVRAHTGTSKKVSA